jgi:ribonuclease HII
MNELGIDEAGRGPVIGPMVIAGVLVDKEGMEKLKNIGVKDSKMLSIAKRESLFEKIKEIALKYKIVILPPEDIDEALNSPTNNLNKFEMVNMAMISNFIDSESIILDAPSNNIDAFVQEFKIFLKNKDRKVTAEHKADTNYPSVAAASILAKVTRDREIEKLKMKVNIDFGSGYPSDPKTQAFLKENYDKYDFFRKSWASWKKIAQNNDSKQSRLNSW